MCIFDVFNNILDFFSFLLYMLKYCCLGSIGYILLYNIVVDERFNVDVGNWIKCRFNYFFCVYYFVCCYWDVRKFIDIIGVYFKKMNIFVVKYIGFSSG